MKKDDIRFMALGGGQEVGASCYFLQLGASSLLLDCGVGVFGGRPFNPNVYRLIEYGLVDSVNQIGQVYISHAHADHVGYLHEFASRFQNPMIYLTDVTGALTELQFKRAVSIAGNGRKLTDLDSLISNRFVCVSYSQTIEFGNYSATFLEAGHIPGAMMILFRFGNRRILYTGDYSLNATSWTSGCQMPEEDIDTLILCGLHARHPYAVNRSNGLERLIGKIYRILRIGRPVYCRVTQLSKGIEIIRCLGSSLRTEYPIFIDKYIYNVINALESLDIPILNENISPLRPQRTDYPHIVVGVTPTAPNWSYAQVNDNFTLHDDFNETVEFVKKINPRLAVIVHSPPAQYGDGSTIEQTLINDTQCRTQCIFPENEDIYTL